MIVMRHEGNEYISLLLTLSPVIYWRFGIIDKTERHLARTKIRDEGSVSLLLKIFVFDWKVHGFHLLCYNSSLSSLGASAANCEFFAPLTNKGNNNNNNNVSISFCCISNSYLQFIHDHLNPSSSSHLPLTAGWLQINYVAFGFG